MEKIKEILNKNKVVSIASIILVIAVITGVAIWTTKSTEQSSNTKLLYCKDCSEETSSPTKFCPNCGEEASWVVEKKEVVKEDEKPSETEQVPVEEEQKPPENEQAPVVKEEVVKKEICGTCKKREVHPNHIGECEECWNSNPDRPWNRPKCSRCNQQEIAPGYNFCVKCMCPNDSNIKAPNKDKCQSCIETDEYFAAAKPCKCLVCGYVLEDMYGTDMTGIICPKCGTDGQYTMYY